MDEHFYVYIMASGRNGTIYIGSTNDLVRRAWEHRNAVVEGFTKKYDCRLLVWYEVHGDVPQLGPSLRWGRKKRFIKPPATPSIS